MFSGKRRELESTLTGEGCGGLLNIPELSSLTREDMALVTESAATRRSFLKLLVLPDWSYIIALFGTPVALSDVGGLLPGVVGALRDEDTG